MIVVISHPDDAHAMRVIRCLEERGEPVLLLDLAQLPRPLQIGTLGQADWSVVLGSEQLLDTESGK